MYFQDSNVLQIANTCKFIELSLKLKPSNYLTYYLGYSVHLQLTTWKLYRAI